MEGDQTAFEATLVAGLVVLFLGALAFRWYARAKFADKQRRYWEQWKREHEN